MTTFFLIRHANTDAAGKVLVGRKPGVHLNEEGRQQAGRLAAMLSRAPIRAIYSSPLERARETAAPLAEELGLAVNVLEAIAEIDCGEWQDSSIDSLAAGRVWERFNRLRGIARIPGGESMIGVELRMFEAMETLRERHPGETIALVSHGDPIRAALACYLGLPLDMAPRFDVFPASVSTVRIGDGAPVVLGINVCAEGLRV